MCLLSTVGAAQGPSHRQAPTSSDVYRASGGEGCSDSSLAWPYARLGAIRGSGI